MLIGIPKESLNGETRVAATPDTVAKLKKLGFEIDMQQVQTNVIRVGTAPVGKTATEFCAAMEANGVKVKPIGEAHIRMICHKDLHIEDISTVLSAAERSVR